MRFTKPPELTEDEWEFMTSPEVYYMDGELREEEAEAILRRKVNELVSRRRHPSFTANPANADQLRRIEAERRELNNPNPRGGVANLNAYRARKLANGNAHRGSSASADRAALLSRPEYSVACPFCDAKARHVCVTRGNRVELSQAHSARLMALRAKRHPRNRR